jgi:hypothetical protein
MIDPARYQMFYDAIRPALRSVPLQRLPPGTIVVRSVAASYKGVAPTRDSARTIFGGSTADFRWSGARPGGRPGRGALYVSRHLDAMSNELLHYASKNPALPVNPVVGRVLMQDALAATRSFRFKTATGIHVADLSSASPQGRAFLRQLDQNRAVKTALAAASYPSVLSACNAPNDYSVSRALTHALCDTLPLIEGLNVVTARDEWAKIGETGENLALFGVDGVPLPSLIPLTETVYGVDASGRLTQAVNHF